jgi:hypothetical protein
MPQGRITKRAVDALQCPAGKDRGFLWDDALAGFGVGAFPTGRKVYVAQYRQNGRSRRVTIGEHGRLTPDEARSQAKTILGAVETGADPIEERRAARAVRTFREMADDFLRLHVATKRKRRTGEEYERLLRLYVVPDRAASWTCAARILPACMAQCLRPRALLITPWRLCPPSGIGPRAGTKWRSPTIQPRALNATRSKGASAS